MAEQYWPGQDPIGKRLRIYGPTEPLLEVVGVVRNSKYVVVFEKTRPFVFLPLERDATLRTLHVRTKGDPALLAPRLEREIAALAPDLPIADLRTMRATLSGIFGYFLFEVGAVQAAGMGLLGVARRSSASTASSRSAPACARVRLASAWRSARSRATCCA